MAPEIPLDIRDAMRDCILSVFWPKKKIIEFFESVGCPNEIVSAVNLETSRLSIIVETFSLLTARQDRGYDTFQVMLDRLSNWSYFDPYYFETIEKLDKAKAEQAINQTVAPQKPGEIEVFFVTFFSKKVTASFRFKNSAANWR